MAKNEIAATNETAMVKTDATFNIPEGYICTLDMSTQEGKVAIANALNGSEPLKNKMGKTLELTGVVTTPGTRAVSGNECTNNYMVLKDGSVLFSQSDGVTRSLKVIVTLWAAQLAAGEVVKVKCIEQVLNNGNTLKTVVPA